MGLNRKLNTNKRMTLLLVLALFIFATITVKVECAEIKIAGGARYNNDGIHGIFGTVQRISDNISEFVSLDMGGDAGAFSALTLVKVKSINNITIHLVMGPAVEFIDEDPTHNIIETAASGTVGGIINWKTGNGTSLWLGSNYLFSNAVKKQFKIGIGYTATLNF